MERIYDKSVRIFCDYTRREETVWFRVLETDDAFLPAWNGCDDSSGAPECKECEYRLTAELLSDRKSPAP